MPKKFAVGIFLTIFSVFVRIVCSIWAVSIILSLMKPEYKDYGPVAVLILVASSILFSPSKTNKITDDDFIRNEFEDFGYISGVGVGLCSILVIAKYIVIWWFGI